MKKTVSVVIPVFNEEDGLNELFQRLSALVVDIARQKVNLELVFVDNASQDATWNILQDWAQKIEGVKVWVVRHPVNLGMQQSLVTGIRTCTGEAIVVLQSDLQDPPELIKDMTALWLGGQKFIATRITSRNEPLLARVGAWFFYRVLSLVSDEPVLWDSSDFYLFDRRLREGVLKHSGSTPFIRSSLSAIATPDTTLTYARGSRASGVTNFNLNRRIRFATDALLRNLGRVVKATLTGASVTGVASLTLLATLAVAYAFGYRSPVSGWISTVGLILTVLASSMFLGAVQVGILARIYRDLPRPDHSLNSEILHFDN